MQIFVIKIPPNTRYFYFSFLLQIIAIRFYSDVSEFLIILHLKIRRNNSIVARPKKKTPSVKPIGKVIKLNQPNPIAQFSTVSVPQILTWKNVGNNGKNANRSNTMEKIIEKIILFIAIFCNIGTGFQ